MVNGMPASELLGMLNRLFSEFDKLTKTYKVEKIKTIGDAYMGGSNITIRNPKHAESCCEMALAMIEATRKVSKEVGRNIQIR